MSGRRLGAHINTHKKIMIEIAIDGSRGCSIALAKDAVLLASLDSLDFGRNLDVEFLPCLQSFLAENGLALKDVDGWTVGIGPGSFAGIRFTLALVKGICAVTGAKARGVPSSFAVAVALGKPGKVCVVQDARCGKVYASTYLCGEQCSPDGKALMLEASQPLPECDFFCSPEGLAGETTAQPCAKYLISASAEDYPWQDTPDIEPVYVRAPA